MSMTAARRSRLPGVKPASHETPMSRRRLAGAEVKLVTVAAERGDAAVGRVAEVVDLVVELLNLLDQVANGLDVLGVLQALHGVLDEARGKVDAVGDGDLGRRGSRGNEGAEREEDDGDASSSVGEANHGGAPFQAGGRGMRASLVNQTRSRWPARMVTVGKRLRKRSRIWSPVPAIPEPAFASAPPVPPA